MQSLRAGLVLALFFAATLPLMPVQLVLGGLNRRGARRFPHWYHRQLCRLLGLRIHIEGPVPDGNPALLVANHISWLDIPVLSAVAPVSFVAKREVASWPFVNWLARLQRTVFVDRDKRREVAGATDEIMNRLRAGDNIVLFAEGTSSDGNEVLPFKTSLFAAAKPSDRAKQGSESGVFVQTVALAYVRRHGLPLGRLARPHIAWYGDMELASHVWAVLKRGPLDVRLRIGEPVRLEEFSDRKALARYAETQVRADLAGLLRPRS